MNDQETLEFIKWFHEFPYPSGKIGYEFLEERLEEFVLKRKQEPGNSLGKSNQALLDQTIDYAQSYEAIHKICNEAGKARRRIAARIAGLTQEQMEQFVNRPNAVENIDSPMFLLADMASIFKQNS